MKRLSLFDDGAGISGARAAFDLALSVYSVTAIDGLLKESEGFSLIIESISDKKQDRSPELLKPFTIKDPRPHLLTILGGKHLRIHDLVIRNSAYWIVHLVGCDDVATAELTLVNSVKVKNSDGIDLDHSKKVRIANYYIESGDDCICLRNRRE